MITEKAKETQEVKRIQSGIRLCQEAITKAEKYERLSENKDWQGYLDDLKALSGLHDNEIKMAEATLIDAPCSGYVKKDDFGKDVYVSSKADWTDFIVKHHIQKEEALKWIKEPDYILAMAKLSREKLPLLEAKLKEIQDASGENGKS